jgi:hypothetical protein
MDSTFTLWLASQPLWISTVLVVGTGVMIAALGNILIGFYYTQMELASNNIIGGFKFGFLAELYAVMVALALVGTWDIYQSARSTVQNEVAALHYLDQAALIFDPDDAARIRDALRRYISAVIGLEWSTMQVGRPSAEAERAFSEVIQAFLQVESPRSNIAAVQQSLGQTFQQIAEYRQLRVSTISRSLSYLIWYMILFATLASIAFPWFFGNGNRLFQVLMSMLLAAIIMLIVLVALKLSHPFTGETGISPDPFLLLMQRM